MKEVHHNNCRGRMARLTVAALATAAMLASRAIAATSPVSAQAAQLISISGDRRTLANVRMKVLGVHITPTDHGLVSRYSPYPLRLSAAPAVQSPAVLSLPNLL